MPWRPASASRFTTKARTPTQRRQWSMTANSILKRTGNEGRAIRGANAAVGRTKSRKKKERY